MERYEWRVADALECTIKRLRRDVELRRIRYSRKTEVETKNDTPIVLQTPVIA